MRRAAAIVAILLLSACRPEVRNPHGYCASDADCPSSMECVAEVCQAPAPMGCEACADPTPLCIDGQCACNGNGAFDSCRGDGRVCVAGACAACTGTSQCPQGACCSSATGRCERPAWSDLHPQGDLPAARFEHSAVYDEAGDRMLVFGGMTSLTDFHGDLWELRFAPTPVWSQLDAGTGPSARIGHVAATDAAAHRMVMVGGQPYQQGLTTEQWALGLSTPPAWQPLGATGRPTPSSGATLTLDPTGRELLLFGGHDLNGKHLAEAWSLSLDSDAWTEITPTGPLPSGRAQHGAAFDPLRRELVVYGGATDSGNAWDVWALSVGAAPAWRPVTTSGTHPSAASAHTAILEPSTRHLIVYGGLYYEAQAIHESRVFSLALADPADPAPWSELKPDGDTPPGRDGHTAIYDPLRGRMVIFGGNSEAPRNDTWALTFPACLP